MSMKKQGRKLPRYTETYRRNNMIKRTKKRFCQPFLKFDAPSGGTIEFTEIKRW